MKATFKLLDSSADIQKNILDVLQDTLDGVFKKVLPIIKNQIKSEVKNALISEPEYQSLISGQLKYELGLPSTDKVNNIIDLWINNIVINYSGIQKTSSGLKGNLSLSMIEDSYNDVLSNDAAIIIDNLSGAALPWLEWLLLYGGKIIVRNYRVQFGANPRSRSGGAIMVEASGSNWRVPPQFAGSSSNNWVTRALSKLDDKIINILEQSLESAI